jgi:photosystem II stability/assembly factor-like uncharacterized protein
MRRYLITAFSVISLVFLSGCSSVSTGGAKSGSIWKSGDSGKTWEVKNQTGDQKTLPAVDILSIVFSPTDKNKILFGTVAHGIIKTDDGGESFESTSFTTGKVYGLLIDPRDENIIYASSIVGKRGKIWKSTDGGKNWKEIYTVPANGPLIVSMLIDRNNSRIVYASTSDRQMIKTADGGETWRSLLTGIGPAVKLAMDRTDSNLIYFMTHDGKIYRSKDAGTTFEDITKKITGNPALRGNIGVMEVDPSFDKGIYLAGQMGVIRSRDGGETWEKIVTLNNPQNFPITALAVNLTNAQEIIVAVAQATYRTVDGGQTWATYQFNYPKAIKFLKYSPLEPGTVFLGFKK